MTEQLQFEGVRVDRVDVRQARFAGTVDIEATDAELVKEGEAIAFVVIVRPNGGTLTTNRKTGDRKWRDTFDIVDARIIDDEDLRDVLVDKLDLEWPNELDLTITGEGDQEAPPAPTTVPSEPAPAASSSDADDEDPDWEPEDDEVFSPAGARDDSGPKVARFNPADDNGWEGSSEREVVGNIHDYRSGSGDKHLAAFMAEGSGPR